MNYTEQIRDELSEAIGMLYAVMATVQGMDEVLRPVVERLEAYRDRGTIDGTATRVS